MNDEPINPVVLKSPFLCDHRDIFDIYLFQKIGAANSQSTTSGPPGLAQKEELRNSHSS